MLKFDTNPIAPIKKMNKPKQTKTFLSALPVYLLATNIHSRFRQHPNAL